MNETNSSNTDGLTLFFLFGAPAIVGIALGMLNQFFWHPQRVDAIELYLHKKGLTQYDIQGNSYNYVVELENKDVYYQFSFERKDAFDISGTLSNVKKVEIEKAEN